MIDTSGERDGTDPLAELADLLEAEHVPVPEHLIEEARREWPDARDSA